MSFSIQHTSGTPTLQTAKNDHDGGSEYRPHELLTALREDALGIPDTTPRLWWQVPVIPGIGGKQLSYQIQITKSLDGFVENAPVQTTQVIRSSQSTAVPWPFAPLIPREIVYWRVRLCVGSPTGESKLTGWSKPARVVAAPQSNRDWDGATGIWTSGGAYVRPADPGPVLCPNATFTTRFKVTGKAAGIFFRISVDCQDGYLWRFDAEHNQLHKIHMRNGHEEPIADVELPAEINLHEYVTLTITIADNQASTLVNDINIDTDECIANDGASFGFRMVDNESALIKSATIVPFNETEPVFQQTYDADSKVPPFAKVKDGAMAIEHNAFGLLGDVLPGDYWALLRHEFILPEGKIAGAFLYATGRSPFGARQHVYRAWINGDYAGQGPTRDIGRRAFETHDVTDLVHPGETNVIAFQAWTQTGGRVQAMLDVHYADGRVETIVTNPSWTGRSGNDWLPWVGDMNVKVNYFVAPREDIDARYEPLGWKTAHYSGTDFKPVALRGTIDNLHADDSAGIAQIEYAPVSVTKLGPGRWLFDAGIERVYSVQLNIVAPRSAAGTKLTLRMGEELTEDGGARYELRSGIRYEDTWTLREGSQQIQHWGYRCFRYLEIDTVDGLNLHDAITFINDVVPEPAQTGSFASSDTDLNEVWQLCATSMIENRNDLYMDTPTRERMPYEGDLLTRGRGEVVYSHSYDLLRKTCRYIVRVPGKFTEYKFMPILMAWEEYMETGDADALSEDWALYEREQGLRWFNRDGLIEKNRKTPLNDDIIDWPQPAEIDGFEFTRVNTVVNAWQYAALNDLFKAAEVSGRSDDARTFRKLANRLRNALNEQTYDPQIGAYHDGRDTDHTAIHSTLYSVALGVTEDKDLAATGEWLTKDNRLDTVPVSCNAVAWLLEALYRSHQDQAALDVMRSHSQTSWWSMMHRWGATQTMEAWSPDIKPNTTFSHPWGASPIVVIARWLLGVQLEEAGASSLIIEPHPADLIHVKGTVITVRGPVDVSIDNGDKTVLSVTLPGNSGGVLRWPLKGHQLEDVSVTYPDSTESQMLSPKKKGDTLEVPLISGTTSVSIR